MAFFQLNARTDAILRRLVRREAGDAVKKVLSRSRPEDVAAAMEYLTGDEQRRLYRLIDDPEFAATVVSHLGDEGVRSVAKGMSESDMFELLDYMEPDDATDMVEVLPDDVRARVIAHNDELSELLSWPSDSAGGIMSSVVFRMANTACCGDAVTFLQQHQDQLGSVHYLYVVDEHGRLEGVISLRALLLRSADTSLVSIMNIDLISVAPDQDQEEVARFVARYDLLAIPVIDEYRSLLGIVTVDDVIDVIRDEAQEDMMLMAGVNEEVDIADTSVFRFARHRAGWLLATAFGGIGAERITSVMGVGVDLAVLAGFIPVVMGMGGNVGIQSTTLAVRGLALGHIQIGGAWRFVIREAKVGLILGALYGMLLGTYGMLSAWPNVAVGACVGVSVLIAVSLGSILGSGLPVLLSRAGVDPAIATGPFVTTAVDILGVVVYFSVARALLPVVS